jgi:oxygen-independent coproporphyrinogen-3 oxidase
VASNAQYLQALANNNLPAEIEELTLENRLNEYIMTSLRTMWGLDMNKLETIASGSSASLLKEAEQFIAKNWLMRNQDIFTLTATGKLYADHIAAELFF